MTVADELALIAGQVRGCKLCPLWEGRTLAVPGAGPPDARLMIIGEAPGQSEDRAGLPFVGAGGSNLDSLLSGAGISRDAVFITNVVKCRPPNNRKPRKGEADACHPYLRRQIELIKPSLIMLLGDTALKRFFPDAAIGSAHGTVLSRSGTKFFPTYHPASVFYNPQLREALEADFRELGRIMGEASGSR